jgi:drug/metabolite transporter (DMT)-like permease
VGKLPILGDALTVLGATGYAGSNVMTEHILEKADTQELLAGLGGCGFVWSLLNVAGFEAPRYREVQWSLRVAIGVLAYTAALYAFYIGAMLLLRSRGSVVRS